MAYPTQRSCNADLMEGMTDGTWKKANRDWETDDMLTAQIRANMSGLWHGFNELNPKILPDGRSVSTRHYFDIEPVDNENV